MSLGSKSSEAGATRTCPHCKTEILQSALTCPACKGYLRAATSADVAPQARSVPLQVDATLPPPPNDGQHWEYSMLLVIRNRRGEEINRKLVGVGAIPAGDERSFSVTVELTSRPKRRH